MKEVDANEATLRFWQEVYDDQGRLSEIHEKYPLDKGHRKAKDGQMILTKQDVAEQIATHLQHRVTLPQLVDWAENAMMDAAYDEKDAATISAVVARLGVADVRAFGLTWTDCEELLAKLGFSARVEIIAA